MAEPKTAPIIPAEPAPAPTESTTRDRLAAFEYAKLGPDAPRHDGRAEKGHGSLFSKLSDADKRIHAALENLIEKEGDVDRAHAALSAAQAAHAEAEKAVDAAHAAAAQAEEKAAEEKARREAFAAQAQAAKPAA